MKEKVKDILRTHVHKHEYPVDSAEIWAGMQNEIEGDKKNKIRIFLIFFSFMAIALIGLFVTNLGQGDSKQISDVSERQFNEAEISTELKNENTNITETQNPSSAVKPASNNSSQKQKINNVKSKIDAGAVQGLTNESKKEKSTLKSVNTNVAKPIASKEAGSNFTNSNISGIDQNNSSLVLANDFAVGDVMEARFNNNSIDSEDPKESDDFGSKTSIETKEIFETKPILRSISGLVPFSNIMVFTEQRSDINIGSEYYSMIDVEKLRPQRSSISFLAGAGIFTKQIVAFDESHKDYAIRRESYEKPLEVINAQALITIPLMSKISLSTGIQYLQFNEELDWEGTYYINGNGDIIPAPIENLVGENYYQEINHSLTNYNQSRLFAVPVLLGLSARNKRLTYGIKAGVNVQLRTKTFGKIFNEDLIPISSPSHKFGLGLQSKLELGYFIVPGLEMYGELSVLQVSTIEEIVDQRIRSYSLGLGLRKNF